MKLRKNTRANLLVAGLLVIVLACIAAYFSTKPAESNISILKIERLAGGFNIAKV